EEYFDQFKNKKSDKSIKQPTFLGETISKQKEIEQAHICFGYNGFSIDHEDITSLLVLNNALGGSMSSRLFQEVREQQGLAYSVFSFHSAYLDSGLLTIYAGTGIDRVNQLQKTISEITLQLLDKGLTDK